MAMTLAMSALAMTTAMATMAIALAMVVALAMVLALAVAMALAMAGTMVVEVAKNYFIKGFAMIKLILIKYLPATYNSYGDGGGDGSG